MTAAPQGSQLKVADSTNRRVTIFDATSITSGEPAVNDLGQATFTITTSATNQSGMKNLQGVALGSVGSG